MGHPPATPLNTVTDHQPPPALDRFLASLKANPSTYSEFVESSELDVSALEALGPDELQVAQDELIAWLKTYADVRAARVLTGFATDEATAALRDVVLRHADSPMDDGLAAAAALRGLMRRGDLPDPEIALKGFHGRAGKKGRRLALTTLAGLDELAVAQRLEAVRAGLADADEDNRIAAGKLMLDLLGLTAHASIEDCTYSLLPYTLASVDETVRAVAERRLEETIREVRERGVPPVPAPPARSADLARFIASMADEEADDYDLDALSRLRGFEQEWMHYVLAERAADHDPRVVRALAILMP